MVAKIDKNPAMWNSVKTISGGTGVYVGSYLEEWDDDELDEAGRCGWTLVTEEWVDCALLDPSVTMETNS